MKVFINYSKRDNKFVNQLVKRLNEQNIDTWLDIKEIAPGNNIASKIKAGISHFDFFIFVLSTNSTNSDWVNVELSATILNEISREETFIIPVLIEDCEIPFSLRDRLYADFRHSFDDVFNNLIRAINSSKKESFQKYSEAKKSSIDSFDFEINNLNQIFHKGDLCLFCGAGISYDAGVPTWNKLLKTLLKEIYSNNTEIPDIDIRLANIFQKRINVSPLILAQYLKILLGNKFNETVRESLYKDCNDKSPVVEEIAELIRPKENRKNIISVVNFNFDDLLEVKLAKEKIEFKSIFSEGERCKKTEFPIYHPHGYLPRSKRLTKRNDIVFSEDGYHSQFIDPYSWGNLVQLSHLNNNTCLFIGISLTDPNMRRLLDVSIRKNGKGERNHFIVKKRYNTEDLYPDNDSINIKDIKVIPVLEKIEEQDANKLGFNVIWINNHKEIPAILKKIGR